MITEKELERVNKINKELYDITSLSRHDITNYNFHNSFSIELKRRLNESAKLICEEYKQDLLKEYNQIIYPNETQDNKQS